MREKRAMNQPGGGLSTAAQHTLDEWHRFVASGDKAILTPLLAPAIVFRSPFAQSFPPGREAALVENFRYYRTFVAAPNDAALEFGANVGKFELKGIDLIRFDASGQMIDFEVMIRPFKALQAVGDAMTARIGPELMRLKGGG
jgi:hypothetical protein